MFVLQRPLIIGVVCLFPLLVYLLLLIGINSRRRASMVPGTWDFAGVLLAMSGFLLGGGPLMLAGFNANWRRFVISGGASDWRALTGEGDIRAIVIWALFFVAVVGGAALLIYARRHATVFYNVDTGHFHHALEWSLGRLAIVWQRNENSYELQQLREQARPMRQKGGVGPVADAPPSVRTATATLRVRELPGSCNVTLLWDQADSAIRDAVEGELSSLLPNMRAEENSAAGWLIMAATALFGIMICVVVFVIIVAVQQRRSL